MGPARAATDGGAGGEAPQQHADGQHRGRDDDADRDADEVADGDEGAGQAGAECGAAGPDPEGGLEEVC